MNTFSLQPCNGHHRDPSSGTGALCVYHISTWCPHTWPDQPPLCPHLVLHPHQHLLLAVLTCSDMPDIRWMSGGVAHLLKNCKYVCILSITTTDYGTIEQSTSDSLGDISWVQKQPHSCQKSEATLPDVNLSWVLPGFPLQATNAGVRRPEYEASQDHMQQATPQISVSWQEDRIQTLSFLVYYSWFTFSAHLWQLAKHIITTMILVVVDVLYGHIASTTLIYTKYSQILHTSMRITS